MGLLALQRLMSLQRDPQRRRRQKISGSIALENKRKGSPCQRDGDGDSQTVKMMRSSNPELPEDIWHHIHSLMPMHDAARVACLSRAFLHSWRCYPNLSLSRDIVRSKEHACRGDLSNKIDHILRNHSGRLKVLKLGLDGISCRYLDSWLHIAVTAGIEELTLMPFRHKYNVPSSLFSDGVRYSIRYLELGFCTFRPTAELGPLRSLTSLHLCTLRITGDELECLLSKALALEQLVIIDCKEIICLKVPCVLQQLSYLKIIGWWRLRAVESKAPNLSNFFLSGEIRKVSLGETSRIKNLTLFRSNVVCYARSELSCTMPNLETLVLSSDEEVVNTPILPTKFLYLKHLTIYMVTQQCMEHESAVGGSSHLRKMPEHQHCCLKSVEIIGFSSAKGLVELACFILKNAVSLECLTLDTLYGPRCFGKSDKRCISMSNSVLSEAPRAVTAIREYIEDKVPSIVQLTVLEPCSRCHTRPGWFLSQIV
ncbi:unnamed protein product [Urochloa decumbens]|uniref:At1g61320/AtMIF1 LRR domain-containing protein n=1 Tax=Urochloa decumbens TaxID=240449 RepID=A0ABC9H042_9POAL